MAKEASIFVRVDPEVKRQAEAVLYELGLSMGAAIDIFLRQVVAKKKIPFELSLEEEKPVPLVTLSDEQFTDLITHALEQYTKGAEEAEKTETEEVQEALKKELGYGE